MKVIGVDPGLSGAFVVLDGPAIVAWLDMPTINVRGKNRVDPESIVGWLAMIGPVDHIALEDVGGLPGMGATSAFTFGQGYGILQGILVAMARPWSTVTPQAWTKAAGVSRDKGEHRQVAKRLFPGQADLFDRVKDDGRADAALIATYAKSRLP